MNNRRNKSKKDKIVIKKDKIIRCKVKMKPVFESDTCDLVIVKENKDSNKICKNCKNSY